MNEQDTPAELHDTVDAELAAEAAEEQGLLFTDDVSPLPSDLGYRGPTACNAAGITYRQLDYWARTGLVEPTVRGASGSGSQRLYSFRDILILKVIKRLLDAGISLQQHPHRRPAPARARHRRPDPRDPDERRRLGLRVHQQRRGHRPAPGRPGRLRHRDRRRLARDRGHPRRPAQRAQPSRPPSPTPATSSPRAGPRAPPAEATHQFPERRSHPQGGGSSSLLGIRRYDVNADHPARESLRTGAAADRSAEGANPPRNLSGARTVRVRQL